MGSLFPNEFVRLRGTDGQVSESVVPDFMKMNHGSELTPDEQGRFLQAYARIGILEKASVAAQVHSSRVKREIESNIVFAEAMKAAYNFFKATLEEVLYDRAVHGWEVGVYDRNGRRVGTEKRFDTSLLMMLAKRHLPEYNERSQMDVNLSGGVLVVPGTPKSVEAWKDQYDRVEGSSGRVEADPPRGEIGSMGTPGGVPASLPQLPGV
jgi:hypothetical protein